MDTSNIDLLSGIMFTILVLVILQTVVQVVVLVIPIFKQIITEWKKIREETPVEEKIPLINTRKVNLIFK